MNGISWKLRRTCIRSRHANLPQTICYSAFCQNAVLVAAFITLAGCGTDLPLDPPRDSLVLGRPDFAPNINLENGLYFPAGLKSNEAGAESVSEGDGAGLGYGTESLSRVERRVLSRFKSDFRCSKWQRTGIDF